MATNVTKYYDFFANHRFSNNADLKFFHNGWFAITESQKNENENFVKIYDEEANLKLKFDNPCLVGVLYKTGYVIVKDIELKKFVVYYGDKEVSSFDFPNIKQTTMEVIYGSCLAIYVGDVYKGIINTKIRSKSENDLTVNLYQIDVGETIFSADCYGNVAYRSGNLVVVLSFDGTRRVLKDAQSIQFMDYKRAIIRNKNNRSMLISYEENNDKSDKSIDDGEVLLSAASNSAIRALGKYAVVFENALVADIMTGNFIMKFDKNYNFFEITLGERCIEPYAIDCNGTKEFYPASFGHCFEVDCDTIFVFKYNERFYPIFIDHRYDELKSHLLAAKIDISYIKMISQAMTN